MTTGIELTKQKNEDKTVIDRRLHRCALIPPKVSISLHLTTVISLFLKTKYV